MTGSADSSGSRQLPGTASRFRTHRADPSLAAAWPRCPAWKRVSLQDAVICRSPASCVVQRRPHVRKDWRNNCRQQMRSLFWSPGAAAAERVAVRPIHSSRGVARSARVQNKAAPASDRGMRTAMRLRPESCFRHRTETSDRYAAEFMSMFLSSSVWSLDPLGQL
jgi:hypothetical protein